MRLLSIFLVLLAINAQAKVEVRDVEKTRTVHKLNDNLTTLEYKLPNGLSVFLTENPKAPNVEVSHWVKAGSLHEKAGITGIAHLFEHMMFRPLSAKQPSFFDIATKLGGDINASTRFESTLYFSAVPPENLNKLLKHESDRFQKLVVTKELLDIERKAVWSEYSTKFDANPVIDLWFQIYQQGYKGHPLGWMIVGFREDLEKITAEDCNAFFKKYYVPNNTGLFVTGNFKAIDALKEIVKLYGGWPAGEASALPPAYNQKNKEIVAEGKLASDAKFYLFGFRTPYLAEGNAKVQSLVDYILFNSKSGLLKKRLVDTKKIAADAGGFNFDYDNGMMKAGITGLPNSQLKRIRTETAELLNDFKRLSEKEFEIYKRNFYISTAESAQRNSDMGKLLSLSWGKYGNLDLAVDFVNKPLDVTKEQVQAFLTQHYTPDNFIFMAHKGQGN